MPRRRRGTARHRARAASRRGPCRRSGSPSGRRLLWQPVAITREQAPWEGLVESGRGEQVVAESRFGARRAATVPLPGDLHPALLESLARAGIDALYPHQADALAAAREGHTIVTTGTASGKSLAFNLPVLDTLAHDARARALYLYPTKALAQDQARKLHELRAPFLRHAIYDGDTPRDERRPIRARSNLILTNPDMVHVSTLSQHRQWGDVLANLAWVVVDEAHVYRGVFGSHVANVLRRLRRLAGAPWTQPRFLLTNAADAHPGDPPQELIQKFARLRLEDAGRADLAERIAPYRAGYTPFQRRDIERRLAEGELLAVVATDALELGIDVGDLDAAICVTFPGTVASLRQMWGRAGRRNPGLALYVAGDDALDQFFCRHPNEFLDRPVESAILDAENEVIHLQHLLCAAHEAPLEPADADVLGPGWRAMAETLVGTGDLRERPGGSFVPRHPEEFPAAAVSLRSTGRDTVAIVDVESGELLGTVDAGRAPTTVHEGAVYLHGGPSFQVGALDLEGPPAPV